MLLLLACAGTQAPDPEDPRRYAEALAAIAAAPDEAAAACDRIGRVDLRDDCSAAAAEAIASSRPDDAQRLCGAIEAPLLADECWFMVAERAKLPALCDRAGRFQGDCAMHLFQQTVAQANPQSPDDPAIPALIAAAGFEDGDPRPLTLVFRHALSAQETLDLGPCAESVDPGWCTRAGEGLLHDRLNHARDHKLVTDRWCGGDRQAVESLRHVPHPTLDAVVALRQAELCP